MYTETKENVNFYQVALINTKASFGSILLQTFGSTENINYNYNYSENFSITIKFQLHSNKKIQLQLQLQRNCN